MNNKKINKTPQQENRLVAAIQELCTLFVNTMGVTAQEVMNAIREVGDDPRDIEKYLAVQKWQNWKK